MTNVELYIIPDLDAHNVAITDINGLSVDYANAAAMCADLPNFFITQDEYDNDVVACFKPKGVKLTLTTANGNKAAELAKHGVRGGVLIGGHPVRAGW